MSVNTSADHMTVKLKAVEKQHLNVICKFSNLWIALKFFVNEEMYLQTFCSTYKWKLSLNLGDQLLFLDLVWNLRFLSLR